MPSQPDVACDERTFEAFGQGDVCRVIKRMFRLSCHMCSNRGANRHASEGETSEMHQRGEDRLFEDQVAAGHAAQCGEHLGVEVCWREKGVAGF